MSITVSFPGGKRVDATVHGFVLSTDQPVELGGEGAAPAPYDLFLGSLATCAGIYALGFCQARGIPTEGLRLEQSTEYDPTTHLASRVRLVVTLPDGFPERHRAGLVRAVELCKVKKTLATPPAFEVVAEPIVAGAPGVEVACAVV